MWNFHGYWIQSRYNLLCAFSALLTRRSMHIEKWIIWTVHGARILLTLIDTNAEHIVLMGSQIHTTRTSVTTLQLWLQLSYILCQLLYHIYSHANASRMVLLSLDEVCDPLSFLIVNRKVNQMYQGKLTEDRSCDNSSDATIPWWHCVTRDCGHRRLGFWPKLR